MDGKRARKRDGERMRVSRTVRTGQAPSSCPALHGSVGGLVQCGRPGLRFWVEPGKQVVSSLLQYQTRQRVDEEQAGLWALQRAPIIWRLGPADPGRGGPKSLAAQRRREETFSKLWSRHPGLIHVEAGIGRATSAARSPLLQRPETRVMCGT